MKQTPVMFVFTIWVHSSVWSVVLFEWLFDVDCHISSLFFQSNFLPSLFDDFLTHPISSSSSLSDFACSINVIMWVRMVCMWALSSRWHLDNLRFAPKNHICTNHISHRFSCHYSPLCQWHASQKQPSTVAYKDYMNYSHRCNQFMVTKNAMNHFL